MGRTVSDGKGGIGGGIEQAMCLESVPTDSWPAAHMDSGSLPEFW